MSGGRVLTVFLNGRYLCQRRSGVQRAAAETVRALDGLLAAADAQRRRRFVLLVPRDASSIPRLRCIEVQQLGVSSGHLWEQMDLAFRARRDLLVSLGNTGPLLAQRHIVTMHDASVFAVPEAYSTAFRTAYRFLLPRLARRALRVVTDSEFSASELVHYAGIARSRLRVVPLGCDHMLEVPAERSILRRHGLQPRGFVVAVGNQSLHKGFDVLLRATREDWPRDLRLVLAGSQEARVWRADPRISFDSSGRILRLGHVSDGELRALYEDAICLVHPSRYEGFGLTPLEAMACGCPVVVSRAGALPEVCDDAAVYLAPNGARAVEIARAVCEVFTRPDWRARLRARGLERALEFRWEKTARAMLELVEQETVGC